MPLFLRQARFRRINAKAKENRQPKARATQREETLRTFGLLATIRGQELLKRESQSNRQRIALVGRQMQPVLLIKSARLSSLIKSWSRKKVAVKGAETSPRTS